MPTIYFQQGELIISLTTETDINVPVIYPVEATALQTNLLDLESGKAAKMIIKGKTVSEVVELMSSFYICISAAGGIIENTEGAFLFIFRRGKWDLPKGKMDEGESALQTAVREIKEETGVTGLEMICPLSDTFHVYEAFGKKWLKTTHWFHFRTSFAGKLIPQTEEDISEIRWVKKEELHFVKENTYPAILDLLA